jgi:hypothetical protein
VSWFFFLGNRKEAAVAASHQSSEDGKVVVNVDASFVLFFVSDGGRRGDQEPQW